jgi:hypothetical protein
MSRACKRFFNDRISCPHSRNLGISRMDDGALIEIVATVACK